MEHALVNGWNGSAPYIPNHLFDLARIATNDGSRAANGPPTLEKLKQKQYPYYEAEKKLQLECHNYQYRRNDPEIFAKMKIVRKCDFDTVMEAREEWADQRDMVEAEITRIEQAEKQAKD